MNANLRLVITHDPTEASGERARRGEDSATRRIYDHWVYMTERRAERCMLGPSRRRAIDRALAMYGEDMLLLAIEGCAASAWHRGANDRQREYTDIELILRDEARIERFAQDGERLRERMERMAGQQAESAPPAKPAPPERMPDHVRERLRDLARRISGAAC